MAASVHSDPFRSERLIYRAIDTEKDVDFYYQMGLDAVAQMQLYNGLPKPASRAQRADFLKLVAANCLLAVVVCLPAVSMPDSQASTGAASTTDTTCPTPIGTLLLHHGSASPPDPNLLHHRRIKIGMSILKPYRSSGYGSEALEWVLDYAFRRAGMHRVSLNWYGWNEGAGRLYERMGFVREARLRGALWHEGRWWDEFEAGMLVEEWEERKTGRGRREERREKGDGGDGGDEKGGGGDGRRCE